MPDANRDRRTRRRLQVCLVLLSGSFWDVNPLFRRDSRVSRVNERVDLEGDFQAAMSLGQSPLATSSGVGSSGWAMLQRRQDIISEGDCDGECDNEGVHKRLVFTVIVMLSSLSFLTSTFVFLTHKLVVKLSEVLMWSGHLPAGKEGGWNRGVAQGACCVVFVSADLPVPVVVFLC